MILAKVQYKTHNGKFLNIIKTFKTWQHYLEGYKYEILVLTDHNNLYRFIDMKNLSPQQIRWAQELIKYHFCIDYY